MRGYRLLIPFVFLAGGLCGCNSTDGGYLTRGIGSDLSSPSLAEQTAQLDTYVLEICKQAGMAPQDGAQCPIDGAFSPDWTIFVQAGMNDIDRRCDDYLQWLDDKRRSTAPILQQIGDTQTGVDAVLAATRVAGPAIGVVAAAFGFARSSYTNFNSRLLLEVDHSTVQAVVFNRQRDFRAGVPRAIDNRPAAIYALRSYLRICMPITIETEINNTVTLFERGVRPTTPLITPKNIRAAMIAGPTAPVVPVIIHPTIVCDPGVCQGPFELGLNRKRTTELQKLACVTPADGRFTRAARGAVMAFLLSREGMKDPTFPDQITAVDVVSMQTAHDKGEGCAAPH